MVNFIQTIPYVPKKSADKEGVEKEGDLHRVLSSELILDEEKENIVQMLHKVENTKTDTGIPFFTIDKEGITSDNLKKFLSTIVSLFEGYDPTNENIQKRIFNMIAGATKAERGLEKVHFFRAPMRGGVEHHMNRDLGEKINKKNDINIWDEKGNGGYYEKIEDVDGYEEVASVYVTEHLLSKKPNAAVVVISANLRPRYRMMNKDCNLDPDELEQLRTMTDGEIKDKYYVSVEDSER